MKISLRTTHSVTVSSVLSCKLVDVGYCCKFSYVVYYCLSLLSVLRSRDLDPYGCIYRTEAEYILEKLSLRRTLSPRREQHSRHPLLQIKHGVHKSSDGGLTEVFWYHLSLSLFVCITPSDPFYLSVSLCLLKSFFCLFFCLDRLYPASVSVCQYLAN